MSSATSATSSIPSGTRRRRGAWTNVCVRLLTPCLPLPLPSSSGHIFRRCRRLRASKDHPMALWVLREGVVLEGARI